MNVLLKCFFTLMFLIFSSCQFRGKEEYSVGKCAGDNPNCNSPSLFFGSNGATSDASGLPIFDGSSAGSIQTIPIKYGESTALEFILTNDSLNPLRDLSVSLSPGSAAFAISDGTLQQSCLNHIFYYGQKCAVRLSFEPGTTLPPIQTIAFTFKTLIGASFKFTSILNPGDLLPDLYISTDDLNLGHVLAYDSSQACTTYKDLNLYNYGSNTSLSHVNVSIADGTTFTQVTGVGAGYCDATSNSLANAGGSCKIRVCFKPLSSGSQTARLMLTASSGFVRQYTLSGTGYVLRASSSSTGFSSATQTLDFGAQPTSGSAVTQDLIFTTEDDDNHAQASSCTFSTSGSVKFAIDNTGVTSPCANPVTQSAAGTCTLRLKFTPAAQEQSHQALLTGTCDNRGGVTKLYLNALSTSKPLTSNVSALDFGSVLIGSTSSMNLSLTNTTSSPLTTVSETLSVSTTTSIVNNNCSTSIAANQSCSLAISYHPTAQGALSDSFGASSAQGSLPSNVGISGHGVTVLASPTNIDFGTLIPGEHRTGIDIVFSNPSSVTSATGCAFDTTTLAAKGITLDSHSTCTDKTSFAVSESCFFRPIFKAPTTQGSYTASIALSCTIGGTAQSDLVGTSQSDLRLVALPPTILQLGTRLVGVTLDTDLIFENQHPTDSVTNLSITTAAPTAWTRGVATLVDCSNTPVLASLAPGERCSVRMRYQPLATPGSEQTGNTQGTVAASAEAGAVDAIDPTYSATAVKISPSRSTLAIGNILNGADYLSATSIYITNPSFLDDASGCSLTSSTADFSAFNSNCHDVLKAGESCSYQIFAPAKMVSSTLAANLDYTCTIGGRARVAATASTRGPATLTLTPTTWDFGDLDIDATATTKVFTATHAGTDPMDMPISALLNSLTGTGFSISSTTCAGTLNQGQSCTITVAFDPTTETTYSGTLTSASAPETLTASTTLTGRGTKIHVVASPNPINLGTTGPNVALLSLPITLTNQSTLLGASGCNITPPTNYSLVSNNCGNNFSLTTGAQCTFKLQFGAQATLGTYTSTDGAVSCTTGIGQSLNATTVVANMPNLVITSGNLSFSNQDVIDGGLTHNITLQNQEAHSMTLTSIGIMGTSSPYTVSGGTCTGATLAASGTCTLSVTFTPIADTTASGGNPDFLLITSTNGGSPEPDNQFPISGTGSTLTLTLSSSSLTFSPREVGQAGTESQVVTLTNSGTRDASLTYSSLTNPPFSQSGCGATLVVGDHCDITIVASAAAAPAVHSPTLTITDTNNGITHTKTIALAGETKAVSLLNIKDSGSNTTYATTIATTDITGAIDDSKNIVDLSPANKSITYTLKNTGSAGGANIVLGTLTLTKTAGTNGTMSFQSNTCTAATLTPGSTCTVDVKYIPSTNTETSTYTLSAPSTNSITGLTLTASVTNIIGASIRSANLTFSTPSLTFGPIASGATSTSSTVTITNSGDQTANSMAFSFGSSGPFTYNTQTCGASLTGQASCTYKVVFTPTTALAANDTAAVNYTSSAASPTTTTHSVTIKAGSYREETYGAIGSGVEGDITSDTNLFYIASKYNIVPWGASSYEPLLTICKRFTNGTIDTSHCGVTDLGLLLHGSSTTNFAGNISGSGPRVAVVGDRIVVMLQNFDASMGWSSVPFYATATAVVCQVPSVGYTVTSCQKLFPNAPAVLSSAGAQSLGNYISLAADTNRLAYASQSSAGLVITVCNWNGASYTSPAANINTCTTTLVTGSSAPGDGYQTDIKLIGTKIYVSEYHNSPGAEALKAVACDINGSNVISCGTLTTIDSDRSPNNCGGGANSCEPGSYPSMIVSGSDVYIAYQYGAVTNAQARLTHCTFTSGSNTYNTPCTTQTLPPTGTLATGYAPKLMMTGTSTTGRLYVAACKLSANNVGNPCVLNIWKCNVASGIPDACGGASYFTQSLASGLTDGNGIGIYNRSLLFDSTNNLLIAPFNWGNLVDGTHDFSLGIFQLGLIPELP